MEFNKPNIIFLSSGKNHHKYFLKYLAKRNFFFNHIIFDKRKIKTSFNVNHSETQKQKKYELKKLGKFKFKFKVKKVIDINKKKNIKIIQKLNPDLGIVFGTSKLSIELIKNFKNGLVNVHRGYIQNYRGLDSEYWTLKNREFNKLGTTIHMIDKELDTGNIIDQKFIKINKKKIEVYKLRLLTTNLANIMIYNMLKKYLKTGKILSKKQKKLGNYYSYMPANLLNEIIKSLKNGKKK